ncbi:MAG TPA: KilA-N domain-containing protein [Chitinophagaceae bacterium]|nr:KilA-N domain-containing protein [Chitinophagaceae bacterium]
MSKSKQIIVKQTPVSIIEVNDQDYISLTDMTKSFGDENTIYSWMRNRNTVEFIGIWEQLYNPGFKGNEFETFKKQAGLNSFNLTPRKWIENTGAIGFISKAGRYGGGTYAHKDIAFEFGSWLSAEFKLYLIKEFQRLKEEESSSLHLEWNFRRMLAKINYHIHNDAVKDMLIPPEITRQQGGTIYASEADLLNVALFGKTAAQWRKEKPGKPGNIRDEATLEQLVVLANLESIHAVFLRQEIPQPDRLKKLNEIAISQMKSLLSVNTIKKLTAPL